MLGVFQAEAQVPSLIFIGRERITYSGGKGGEEEGVVRQTQGHEITPETGKNSPGAFLRLPQQLQGTEETGVSGVDQGT